jgi:di/tricarboxylate transporter
MSGDAWITLAVSVATLVLLATDRFSPALVMAGAVTVLLVVGVVDQEGALLGFSNDAPITVACLYVLAGAVKITGAFEELTEKALGGRGEPGKQDSRRTLTRILFPSMAASAFIANTPLVAMTAPRVLEWARRTGRSASRYLMPLSYAIIFGGCITLVGTSTNLVVHGLLKEFGFEGLSVFEITPVGLPVAFLGTIGIILLTPLLLKDRSGPDQGIVEQVRRFTIEMEIAPDSPMDGQTVADAGLRQLEGVFLIEVERAGQSISPVAPDQMLEGGDRLTFSGNVSRIVDLQRMPGLISAEHRHFETVGEHPGRAFFEVVIGESSPLVGSTLKEIGFRARYGAAVVAIHRSGEAIPGKLGDCSLRAGDLLLVLGGPNFRETWREQQDFLMVAPLQEGRPLRREKARIVELMTLGLILVAGTGLMDLLQVSLVLAIALTGFKIISLGEARSAVDLEVVVLMATSFGLGIAIRDSGLADEIATLVVNAFEPLGDVGVLAGILIATMVMTELLSNNAAAVLMFPIAIASAQQAGLDPRPFAVVILFGATLSFLTPIGYQTNTLVWSMGGYRYGDFSRLGAPLTVMTVVLLLILVPIFFPFQG